MKIIALGDTHGRDYWKEVVNQEFDHIVFIGDYFDSFDIPGDKQVQNFLDIIAFRDSLPDKVTLLLGNHEYHYLDVNEIYTGFQNGYQYMIRDVLLPNLKKLQICKILDDVFFTHAGITTSFLKKHMIIEGHIEQGLNDLFTYKPLSFKVIQDGYRSDNSPIWVRPEALYPKRIRKTQVVGHTSVSFIKEPQYEYPVYYIDVLGKCKQYLTIENKEFKINVIR